jgi:hypothetical protein
MQSTIDRESLQCCAFIAVRLVVIYNVEVQLTRLDGIPRYDLGIGASGVISSLSLAS